MVDTCRLFRGQIWGGDKWDYAFLIIQSDYTISMENDIIHVYPISNEKSHPLDVDIDLTLLPSQHWINLSEIQTVNRKDFYQQGLNNPKYIYFGTVNEHKMEKINAHIQMMILPKVVGEEDLRSYDELWSKFQIVKKSEESPEPIAIDGPVYINHLTFNIFNVEDLYSEIWETCYKLTSTKYDTGYGKTFHIEIEGDSYFSDGINYTELIINITKDVSKYWKLGGYKIFKEEIFIFLDPIEKPLHDVENHWDTVMDQSIFLLYYELCGMEATMNRYNLAERSVKKYIASF